MEGEPETPTQDEIDAIASLPKLVKLYRERLSSRLILDTQSFRVKIERSETWAERWKPPERWMSTFGGGRAE
jgi:hypothetical protein